MISISKIAESSFEYSGGQVRETPWIIILLYPLFSLVIGCVDERASRSSEDQDQVISEVDAEQSLDVDRRDQSTLQSDMIPRDDLGISDAEPVVDLDEAVNDLSDLDVSLIDIDAGLPLDRVFAQYDFSSAQVTGVHHEIAPGLFVLDAGSKVRWTLDDEVIPRGAQVALSLQSQVWRFEDGAVIVRSDRREEHTLVWGDGRDQITPLRMRYEDWRDGDAYGAGAVPPRLLWDVDETLTFVEIEVVNGGLIMGDLVLHEVHASLDGEVNTPDTMAQVLEYQSCLSLDLEEECDDGIGLSNVIDTAPPGSLSVKLTSPLYHATTPVWVRRSNVEIKGLDQRSGSPDTLGSAPIWRWSPGVGSGQSWPIVIRGTGAERTNYSVTGDITAGQRRVTVTGQVDSNTRWVQLGADDFGEVPPVCVDGRDVERYHRHQRQLFRVLEVIPGDVESELILDRAINLNIPLSAQPTLTPMDLLTDVRISDLQLEADCPEAFDVSGFTQARCQNPEVIDDGGVLSLYTDEVTLTRISARGFGKFTIELRDSLLNTTLDCEMSDPSAYGSGGQGYGVHLIGASRSLIIGSRVTHARHGVVVDFGSSDSQIIDGVFSEMNQALIDVHGEASRDTLIRGNSLSESSIGVIIGGGGRAVHCNDGPRHHVIDNRITDCGIGVSVSDYTEDVGIRSNHLTDNGSHVVGAFGARQIDVERNRLTAAQIRAISLSFEDTGDIAVYRNLFTDLCAADEATLVLRDAEPPRFSDNLWCP